MKIFHLKKPLFSLSLTSDPTGPKQQNCKSRLAVTALSQRKQTQSPPAAASNWQPSRSKLLSWHLRETTISRRVSFGFCLFKSAFCWVYYVNKASKISRSSECGFSLWVLCPLCYLGSWSSTLERCTMCLAQWCSSEGWPLKPAYRGWCTAGWGISTPEVMEESISTVLCFKRILSEFSYIKPSKGRIVRSACLVGTRHCPLCQMFLKLTS